MLFKWIGGSIRVDYSKEDKVKLVIGFRCYMEVFLIFWLMEIWDYWFIYFIGYLAVSNVMLWLINYNKKWLFRRLNVVKDKLWIVVEFVIF